jgi:hypothetical protein
MVCAMCKQSSFQPNFEIPFSFWIYATVSTVYRKFKNGRFYWGGVRKRTSWARGGYRNLDIYRSAYEVVYLKYVHTFNGYNDSTVTQCILNVCFDCCRQYEIML